MYISKSLLILIALIILSIIHIIIHIIIFIKLHNLKGDTPINFAKIKEKGKELFFTLLKPDNSIISGFKEFIFNSIHTQKDEDDEEGKKNG